MRRVECGDCLDLLRAYDGPLFSGVVTDPPGAKGMAEWDSDMGGRDAWVPWLAERLAALRERCEPGAWSLTWAHPSTSGWTQRALEDAGWKVVDKVVHLNAQGRAAGMGRLAPGHEDWWLAWNPAARAKPHPLRLDLPVVAEKAHRPRHPKNVVLSEGAPALLALEGLYRQSGSYSGLRSSDKHRHTYGTFKGSRQEKPVEGDEGPAARFFPRLGEGDLSVYAPKARFHERALPGSGETEHPTAKSPTLAAWLVHLLGLELGQVLADPFCGSGVVLEVAAAMGLGVWGCDLERRWVDEAASRLRWYDPR